MLFIYLLLCLLCVRMLYFDYKFYKKPISTLQIYEMKEEMKIMAYLSVIIFIISSIIVVYSIYIYSKYGDFPSSSLLFSTIPAIYGPSIYNLWKEFGIENAQKTKQFIHSARIYVTIFIAVTMTGFIGLGSFMIYWNYSKKK